MIIEAFNKLDEAKQRKYEEKIMEYVDKIEELIDEINKIESELDLANSRLEQVKDDITHLNQVNAGNSLHQRINERNTEQYELMRKEENKLIDLIRALDDEFDDSNTEFANVAKACNIMFDALIRTNDIQNTNTSLILTGNSHLSLENIHYLKQYALPDIVNTMYKFKEASFYTNCNTEQDKKDKFKDYLYTLLINKESFNNRHGNIRNREKLVENFDVTLANTLVISHKFKDRDKSKYLDSLTIGTSDLHIPLLTKEEMTGFKTYYNIR